MNGKLHGVSHLVSARLAAPRAHRVGGGYAAAMPRRSPRRATCAAVLLATAALAGCSGSEENPDDKVVQQGSVLNAVDTAVVVDAHRDLDLACRTGSFTPELQTELTAAARIARERPGDVFESGDTDEARRMDDELVRLAEQVARCGEPERARGLIEQAQGESG